MALTYKEVSEILKIIDSSICDEVILELENTRLVVRRSTNSVPLTKTKDNASPLKTDNILNETVNHVSGPPKEMKNKTTLDSGEVSGSIIKSPMVGTFYQSPSPEEPPFVTEGSKVKIGDPLCLIEVMKLYTTVEATVNGKMNSVLVTDGTLVQFDQPLFSIDTD